MKTEYKDKWVKALRSGEYKQADGALSPDGDSFCCLGVLCEVLIKDGVAIDKTMGENSDEGYRYSFGDTFDWETLPEGVADFVGLSEVNPRVVRDDITRDLATINDSGTPFDEIADLIEAQL